MNCLIPVSQEQVVILVVRQFMSQLGKRVTLKGNTFWLTMVKAIAWFTQGELEDTPVN